MYTKALAIVKKLSIAGYSAYFAGGWVRDFLLGHPSEDIDIATSAPIEEIQKLFPKTIPIGIRFGIILVIEEDHPFEVATFRKEESYFDGRRPSHVEPATAEEDAWRRDFTINGMFYDPLTQKLLDFVGGQADLKEKKIRAIGNPVERFQEDRLRMIRAARYATRFSFAITPETKEAIITYAPSLLPAVSMERVWQELQKMTQGGYLEKGLIALHQLHLLPVIFPALKKLDLEEVSQRVQYLPYFPPNTPLIAQLLELFPESSLPEKLALCAYLKTSNQDKSLTAFLFGAKELFSRKIPPEKKEWVDFYAHPHAELALQIHAAHYPPSEKDSFLHKHAEQKSELASAIERARAKRTLVTSEHLFHEGVLPGKAMGLLLSQGERLAVNSDLHTPEAVIAALKRSPYWPSS